MNAKYLIATVLLGISGFAYGQDIRYSSTVQTIGGFPYATVRVCTEPASGTPCTPLATNIYSDPGGTQPITGNFFSDANGNFAFYGSPTTTYHVQISGTGLTTYDIPYITLPGAGAGTVTTLSSGNLSPLFTTSVVTPTTTPALSFALSNAAATSVLCNALTSSGAPSYCQNPVVQGITLAGITGASPQCLQASTVGLVSGAGGPCGGLPATGYTGDTLRYNVNGDSAWDAANIASKILGISIDASNTNNYDSWGTPLCGCGNTFSSSYGVAPTATDGWGQTLQSVSTASTTTIGVHTGENGNNTLIGILSWYRWSMRFRLGGTTNMRAWLGMGVYYVASGVGVNSLQLDGTTAYASDLPNKTTVGFRYSSTTDTYWQAVSIVAGGSPVSTVTSTGIAPDTGIHLFEMATNSTGTAVYYFIDHVLVATITTNLPSIPAGGTFPSPNYDLVGAPFWTADNKNTANAVSATWFGVNLSLK